jgi:hypothetical protein
MSHGLAYEPVAMEDCDGRRRRAFQFLTGTPQERRFGFWKGFGPENDHLPTPIVGAATAETGRLFAALKEIEARWAGYASYRGASLCRVCYREGKPATNGNREFIFRPTENGPVYRWPQGLMHYYDQHKIATPMWLTELVQEYTDAKIQGAWS